jgi:hypothetical protein
MWQNSQRLSALRSTIGNADCWRAGARWCEFGLGVPLCVEMERAAARGPVRWEHLAIDLENLVVMLDEVEVVGSGVVGVLTSKILFR